MRTAGSESATLRAAYSAASRLQDRFAPLDGLGTLVLGHSRDQTAREAARLLLDHLVGRGVDVRDVVDWPEQAASWLRQATRFTAFAPALWVVLIGDGNGWMRMRQRLHDTAWDPDRTVVITTRP